MIVPRLGVDCATLFGELLGSPLVAVLLVRLEYPESLAASGGPGLTGLLALLTEYGRDVRPYRTSAVFRVSGLASLLSLS